MSQEMEVLVRAIVRGAADQVRRLLPLLKPGDRLILFDKILEGYCKHCGSQVERGGYCPCDNDE